MVRLVARSQAASDSCTAVTDPAGSAAAVFGALQEKTRPSRPLCLPLFAALASEADGSAPGAFLRNPGRLALVLRDMARTLPIDVLMVDSGSLWELEIAGFSVDSTSWPPRLRGGSLRPVPPVVLARAFLGMFFSYYITEILLGQAMPPELRVNAIERFSNFFFMYRQASSEVCMIELMTDCGLRTAA